MGYGLNRNPLIYLVGCLGIEPRIQDMASGEQLPHIYQEVTGRRQVALSRPFYND
jgi:hypothetical protein